MLAKPRFFFILMEHRLDFGIKKGPKVKIYLYSEFEKKNQIKIAKGCKLKKKEEIKLKLQRGVNWKKKEETKLKLQGGFKLKKNPKFE